jgi:hypothetical protein
MEYVESHWGQLGPQGMMSEGKSIVRLVEVSDRETTVKMASTSKAPT